MVSLICVILWLLCGLICTFIPYWLKGEDEVKLSWLIFCMTIAPFAILPMFFVYVEMKWPVIYRRKK